MPNFAFPKPWGTWGVGVGAGAAATGVSGGAAAATCRPTPATHKRMENRKPETGNGKWQTETPLARGTLARFLFPVSGFRFSILCAPLLMTPSAPAPQTTGL